MLERDNGLCVRCGRIGKIVHHKKYITAQNCDDLEVTMNIENLETLCKECHDAEHLGSLPTENDLRFDDQGNLIRKEKKE